MITIQIIDETRKIKRSEMNYIGIALICLIALQWTISLLVYCAIAAKYGQPVSFYGFAPNELLKSLAQLNASVAKIPVAMPLVLFTATLIGNSVPFIICSHACGQKVIPMFSHPNIDVGTVVIFGIVAFGANSFVSIFIGNAARLLKFLHLKLETPSFNIPWKSPLGAVAIIIAAVVIAPLTEEFIFRGLLLRVFLRYGDVFAVIASSFVWALMHGNFVQGLPVFFMGLFLGRLAIKSGSLLPTLIIHAANNAIALIENSVPASNILFKSSLGLFNFEILLTAIVLFSLFYKKFKIENKEHSAGGFAAIFTSIPLVIAIVFCAVRTILSVKPF